MDIFYLVWEPVGGYAKRRHSTIQDATAEAERLAEKHPVKEYYVLKALSISKTEAPVQTHKLTDLPY